MKYINIKRIILNIGLLIFLLALIFAGYSTWSNRNAAYTKATIVSSEPSKNMSYHAPDGTIYRYDELVVEYSVDGVIYTGETIALPGEYEIGGEVEYCYNRKNPEEIFFDTLTGDLMLAGFISLISIIIIFVCRSAFNGYKKDFLCRYKKSVIFSIVTGWIPILYYLWLKYIFVGVGFMAGLFEFLFLLFLLIFIPVVNIIVWIVAAVKYVNKAKQADL